MKILHRLKIGNDKRSSRQVEFGEHENANMLTVLLAFSQARSLRRNATMSANSTSDCLLAKAIHLCDNGCAILGPDLADLKERDFRVICLIHSVCWNSADSPSNT